MATTPSAQLVNSFDITTSYQTIYTLASPYSRASIDAAVINNYSSSNITYSLRIVQSGASGDNLDEIITEKSIRAKNNDLAPALIGQGLSQGDFIQIKASANSSANIHLTGTLIT